MKAVGFGCCSIQAVAAHLLSIMIPIRSREFTVIDNRPAISRYPGTFAGESLPGKMTWARSYIKANELWMDIGRGEVVKLPAEVRDAWWNGTTRQWPFMAADLGCSMETVMAHYMSNHIAVAYGDIFNEMVASSQLLGFKVRVLANWIGKN